MCNCCGDSFFLETVLLQTGGECQRAPSFTAMPQLRLDASSVKEDIPPIDGSRRHRWGLVVTGFVGGTLVALYAIATPFVTPAFRKVCLPFVPATPAQVNNVLKLLRYRSGTLVDIGSGDGRIVSGWMIYYCHLVLDPLIE